MSSLTGSVGRGGVNRPDDVRAVQTLLNRYAGMLGLRPLPVDGAVGWRTIAAIRAFQSRIGFNQPDGRINPGGRTHCALVGIHPPESSSLSGLVTAEARS